MTNPSRISCTVLVLMLSACAGVNVSTLDNDAPLKGIPFRVKVPVLVQETQLAETGYLVQFKVVDDDPKTEFIKIPAAGAVLVPCASPAAVRSLASSIAEQARQASDAAGAAAVIETHLRRLAEYVPSSASECSEFVSNTLKQESRISTREYFITHIIPLFGSGTGAYELNADGTLSKASTTITDETGKTLLGLFPFKEELLDRWIKKPATVAALADGTAKTPGFHVEATYIPRVTMYTMKRDAADNALEYTNGAFKAAMPPLAIADARTGNNGVQLVSIERGDEATAPKANPKAFTIQGAVIPPAAE